MTSEHHVSWFCASLASSEHAVLRADAGTQQLRGFAVLPRAGVPCHIEYEVLLDQWRTHRAYARVNTAGRRRDIVLFVDDTGSWTVDSEPATQLDGCTDIDLGWSPVTNTIPIQRLGLATGETATITAAWIRFPELDIVASTQRYTRLARDRWRYESGAYDFELRTDPETGLVLQYGDDLWRAVATVAHGTDPTASRPTESCPTESCPTES